MRSRRAQAGRHAAAGAICCWIVSAACNGWAPGRRGGSRRLLAAARTCCSTSRAEPIWPPGPRIPLACVHPTAAPRFNCAIDQFPTALSPHPRACPVITLPDATPAQATARVGGPHPTRPRDGCYAFGQDWLLVRRGGAPQVRARGGGGCHSRAPWRAASGASFCGRLLPPAACPQPCTAWAAAVHRDKPHHSSSGGIGRRRATAHPARAAPRLLPLAGPLTPVLLPPPAARVAMQLSDQPSGGTSLLLGEYAQQRFR